MKYPLFVLLFILNSCAKEHKETIAQNLSKAETVIVIQPLGNFNSVQAQKVFDQIKAINSKIVLRQNIPFPKNSFYKPRNRYRADSIINNLQHKIGADSVIVGLSNLDISTTKDGIKDWGVMGLGYKPGKACVVSDFRLDKKNKTEQFYKLVLHELGHTAGLPHCKTKTCLMADANRKNHFDDEKDFCSYCKKFLKGKGWQLH